MRILLLNLTRLGDLLECQPLVSALKEKGHKVSLVCLENFAEAAALFDGLEAVYPFAGHSLLAKAEQDWRMALGFMEEWLHSFALQLPLSDYVLNLTPTTGARLLGYTVSRHFGIPLKGFALDEHGFGVNTNPWATFIQAASLSRGCSPVNVVDAFCAMGECTAARNTLLPVAEATKEAMLASLKKEAGDFSHFVVLQLGASEERRRWPVAFFVATAKHLLAHGIIPVLVGSTGERPLAEEYLSLSPGNVIDKIGRTSLSELATILSLASLLITNDTGTMHLAAGLGTPILAIFLATAQPWDTGPYAENCLCLEPNMPCHPCGFGTLCSKQYACLTHIEPSLVANLALGRIEQGAWQILPAEQGKQSMARVWRTCKDSAGFMGLEPMPPLLQSQAEAFSWMSAQRLFYRHLMVSLAQHYPLPQPEYFALEQARAKRLFAFFEQAASHLLLLAEQAQLLEQTREDAATARIAMRMREAFLRSTEQFSALLASQADFVTLAHLWQVSLQEYATSLTALRSFFQALSVSLDFFKSCLLPHSPA